MKKDWLKKSKKGLVCLFVVMFAFTVLSRITASLTVAQVWTENPESKKIEHIVTASGIVEKNRELAVMTEPDILVGAVYISEGQKVLAGDALAELDPEDLAERILLLEDEIEILKLTNQALLDAREKENRARSRAEERAREDYARAVSESEAALWTAAEELQSAEDAYYSYESAHEGDSSEETFGQLLALQSAMRAKQAAFDALQKSSREAVTAAGRAIEDASLPPANDHSVEINRITAAQKERELKRLYRLRDTGGKITAPADGVVTEINIKTGQKTGDTAAAAISDTAAGFRYQAVVTKEDSKYVSAGDEVTLSKGGKKTEGLVIDTVEIKEDGSAEVTVLLSDTQLSIGDTADMELKKNSERYGCTVPLTALRSEAGKTYVYVIDVMDTVLGEAYTIRRVDVTVRDQNSQYAALGEGMLSGDDRVVVDMDRYVEAGSRVRLLEP